MHSASGTILHLARQPHTPATSNFSVHATHPTPSLPGTRLPLPVALLPPPQESVPSASNSMRRLPASPIPPHAHSRSAIRSPAHGAGPSGGDVGGSSRPAGRPAAQIAWRPHVANAPPPAPPLPTAVTAPPRPAGNALVGDSGRVGGSARGSDSSGGGGGGDGSGSSSDGDGGSGSGSSGRSVGGGGGDGGGGSSCGDPSSDSDGSRRAPPHTWRVRRMWGRGHALWTASGGGSTLPLRCLSPPHPPCTPPHCVKPARQGRGGEWPREGSKGGSNDGSDGGRSISPPPPSLHRADGGGCALMTTGSDGPRRRLPCFLIGAVLPPGSLDWQSTGLEAGGEGEDECRLVGHCQPHRIEATNATTPPCVGPHGHSLSSPPERRRRPRQSGPSVSSRGRCGVGRAVKGGVPRDATPPLSPVIQSGTHAPRGERQGGGSRHRRRELARCIILI